MISLKNAVIKYLAVHPPAWELFSQLLQAGDLYLIGGILREFCDNGALVSLRDIDIIVDVKNQAVWQNAIAGYALRSNRFGGHKLYCSDLLVDAWAIDQTWAFREGIINANRNDYIKLLPETVFLNIDAIIYDWTRDYWQNQYYLKAMKDRMLDVILPENPQIALNLVRAFVLQERYHMALSSRLQEIVCSQAEKHPTVEMFVTSLMEEQQHRYRKEIISRVAITAKIEDALKNK